jgi:flagellar hook-basal body complex protein FliE
MLASLGAMNAVAASATRPSGGAEAFTSRVGFAGKAESAGKPFAGLLTDAVGQVNALEDQASAAMTGLMTGSGVDIHQAMIAAEKASMGFEMALALRNKAVQAYQSVMGMQF